MFPVMFPDSPAHSRQSYEQAASYPQGLRQAHRSKPCGGLNVCTLGISRQ